MNDNAKKWVAALRSGEYSQCRNHLVFGKQYCCLGVACDIYQKEVGDLFVTTDKFGVTRFDNEDAILVPKVSNYFGLRNTCPTPKDKLGVWMKSLASMNDDGADFNTIADTIEKHQDTLFITETCNPS